MDYEEVQKKGKQVMNDVLQTAQEQGKKVIDKVTQVTKKMLQKLQRKQLFWLSIKPLM